MQAAQDLRCNAGSCSMYLIIGSSISILYEYRAMLWQLLSLICNLHRDHPFEASYASTAINGSNLSQIESSNAPLGCDMQKNYGDSSCCTNDSKLLITPSEVP